MSERAPAAVAPLPAKRAPSPARQPILLQRKCACGAGAGAGGQRGACAEQASMLQRRASTGSARAMPASVGATLAQPGRPLEPDTRSFMEKGFGADFGAVRVHDDSTAAGSARAVDAHAYTVGQHLVFDQGQYQPHSESGRHLIAHELAHTLQQQGLQRAGVSNLEDQGAQYQRLEREADHAADAVMRGQALSPGALSHVPARLARKEKSPDPTLTVESSYYSEKNKIDVQMATQHKVTPEKSHTVKENGKDKEHASFLVDQIELNESKGAVGKEWESKAKAGALRATVTMDKLAAVQAGHWQERVSSDELRKRWLNQLGWKVGDAGLNEAWQNAGKAEGANAEFPKVAGVSCEMDHIIELQVGGDNTEQNIQVLDRPDNGASGSLIWQQVRGLAQAIAGTLDKDQKALPAEIRMVFQGVKAKPGNCGPCCKTAAKFKQQNGKAKPGDKGSVKLDEYAIAAGGRSVALLVDGKKKRNKIFESDVAGNTAAAEILPGLLLHELNQEGGPAKHHIDAHIDARSKTRLPITLPGKGTPVRLNVAKDGDLTLSAQAQKDAGIAFTYDYLSPGRFTKLHADASGLSGEGYITPQKVPFLPRLEVAFSPDYFRIKAPLDKDKLKPPFPGVKITEGSLGLELAPKLKAVGSIGFEFGTARKLASSKLEVSADEAGLVLKGKLNVFLPGVDDASGEITWQGGVWSGGAVISATKLRERLKYVQGGELRVGLKEGKIDAGGTVKLMLPGENEADLELGYRNNKWLFAGRGAIKVNSSYLKPIQAALSYDGELFKASGRAGFAFKGLDGTLDATYENKDGAEKVYGKGDIKIDQGRAKGNMLVELHPNQSITGKGKLSYEIRKGLVASAGITIDDKQKITFDGELSFPDIELFKRFPASSEKHSIFKASASIPIPGASIGPIGLVVKVYGGLEYYYFAGPGVLKNVKAEAKFNPFEADPDFSFKLKATASIPAGGGITGTIGADLAIDAVLGSVGGGLSVSATAGLEGKAELASEINYAKDRFSIDASAYVGGKVILGAGLDARVYAEAGALGISVRTEKVWNLAKTSLDTGLALGMRLPLHYDSVDGFKMPSLSDIKPEPANLDINPSRMLEKLFGDAKSSEKKG
ncbi:DUF4157 domain-containing protein [Massilia sp. TWP1-3-3]|uniref:eCIS core domain-containing protein n=1 Tax=Massilia sp. TWP1-3-3 TaxID=2804573 RepID=UPI003CE6DEF3